MTHPRRWLALVALLALAVPAFGFITRLTPLKEVIGSEQLIFIATVDKIDPDKPAVVFTVGDKLKGEPGFTRLPVNFTGDSEAKKHAQVPQLLKRLKPGLPVLLFASTRGAKTSAFAFTDGTWFHLLGQKDGDAIRWGLTHGEPYLRRTFKGTTDELKQIVTDALAGKSDPPAPNEKEAPGFGPEVKPLALLPTSTYPFAVIPTFLLVGPLALLAALFPAVFGGLALLMKRWVAALTIVSLVSTVYLVARWGYLPGEFWRKPLNLWATLTALTAVGLPWAVWRYRAKRKTLDAANFQSRKGDVIVLSVSLAVCLAGLAWCHFSGRPLFDPPGRDLVLLTAAALGGLLVAGPFVWREGKPFAPLSAETGLLAGLTLALAAFGTVEYRRTASAGGGVEGSPSSVQVAWTFDFGERGSLLATPAIDGNRLYAAGAMNPTPTSRFGQVVALELPPPGAPEAKLQPLWKFDDDEGMKTVYCGPCVSGGSVFIGEGLHEDGGCRLFALDAATGKKRPAFADAGAFATDSHTESTPAADAARVYFGAGDAGVYALDAKSGRTVWCFSGPHVDAAVLLHGGKIYGGGGVSRKVAHGEVFALDAATGKDVWRMPLDCSAWGAPVLADGQLFYGVGNGKLTVADAASPGGLLCVDAATGRRIWLCDAPDAVLTRPAVGEKLVYFGCRDGFLYGAERNGGKLTFKVNLGSPVVAAPVVSGDTVYAVNDAGHLSALDATTGAVRWAFDPAKHAGALKAQGIAAPVIADGPSGRLIVLAVTLTDSSGETARLFGLREGR